MPHLPVDGSVTATEILCARRAFRDANAQVEARAKELGLEYHLRPSPRSPKGRSRRTVPPIRSSDAISASRASPSSSSTASTPSPARSPWVCLAGRLRLRGGRSSASSRGSASINDVTRQRRPVPESGAALPPVGIRRGGAARVRQLHRQELRRPSGPADCAHQQRVPGLDRLRRPRLQKLLVELYAYVGDVLTFYQDNVARKSRLVMRSAH